MSSQQESTEKPKYDKRFEDWWQGSALAVDLPPDENPLELLKELAYKAWLEGCRVTKVDGIN